MYTYTLDDANTPDSPQEEPFAMSTTPAERLAAISGGASGIGLAFARHWIAEGGRAVLLDRSPDALEAAVAELGDRARSLVTDVTDESSVARSFAEIAEREGRLDAVVNSAGIALPAPSHEMSDEQFTRVMDIHVTGTFRCCRAAYSLLTESDNPAIVNMASVAALTGMPGRANYTAAKAGIAGLTRTLAVEWAPHGIRVNAVGAGYVRTPFTDQLITDGKLRTEEIESRTPLARFAKPEEVAEVIDFLTSSRSSYVTGHLLMADGGLTIQGDWY